MKKAAGFTLIEILVVVVIISIVVTSTLLIMHNFLQDRRMATVAKELNAVIPVAQQQAMLQPAVLGLKIMPNKYEFYRFIINTQKNTGAWQLINRDQILNSRTLPSNIKLFLTTHQQDILANANNPQTPQIIFFPSGDMTPFVIEIGTKKQAIAYSLSGMANGNVTLSKFTK